ncbi:hypothetical protein [Dictyobacter kobayashii]|uniref:Uncharacterized protein n=1 Tax=Dictyobacter kobayashii TaxID=2014872 RepID=A0A402AMC4_9CHLR|nr:hypothetical protein [Dictyobacter kobayashii]GCE20273.1 hypothetical protein KDK_40730 [Dictyobacter kobayashii]
MAQRDMHTSGGITSQLQLQQNIVSGTVTSTLPYTLTDAFVVMGNSYVSLGDLPPNSTKKVSVNLGNNSSNAAANNTTIADQIASSRGMTTNPGGGYYSYNNNNQVTDAPHRHVLMMEALSGGYCDNNSCYHQNVQLVNNSGVVTKRFMIGNTVSDHDPLLLSGSTATIIGWAQDSNALNGTITVNGQDTNGSQETMVQAPLDINFTGNVQIPSSIINSQIVHIQQTAPGNIQEPALGTYMMTTGSITLEYTIPTIAQLENSSLTFTSSVSPTKGSSQTVGITTNINHIQTYLYNWQTGNWDSVSFSEFTCTVKSAQPYVGPGDVYCCI